MNYTDRDTYGMYKNKSGGPGPYVMGADTLIGDDVYNQNGEDLGDIKEIMLDMRSGTVDYAVLSFGGFLGMGEKLFAVPWNALKLDPTNKRFILNIEKERLESAPGFDKDHWPDMADPAWVNEINAYYGTQASGQQSGSGTQTGTQSGSQLGGQSSSQSGSQSGNQPTTQSGTQPGSSTKH